MRMIHALFDDYFDANQAVADLEAMRIPSKNISIISHHDETSATGVGAGIGGAIGGAGGLLAGLGIMAIPGIGQWWLQDGLLLLWRGSQAALLSVEQLAD